jgi:uncharacterized protein involved in exopolysaccharide biosynthesis
MATRRPELDLPYDDDEDGSERAVRSRPTLVERSFFALRAVRRHKLLFLAVFMLGLAASAAYYRFKTPVYRVETKILTQRQQALPSAVRPTVDEAPTRSAWEIVHRRENLISLIKDVQMLSPTRAPPAASPREGLRLLTRPMDASEEDQLDRLVLRLDRALRVTTDDGTITIGIDWPDPQHAYHLVEGALQNFLEARHLQEVTAIDEVISLLQGRAATLRERLQTTIEEVRRDAARGSDGLSRVAAPSRSQASEDVVRLRTMLEAKERAIQDVEEFRRRRLADLQAQLDEKRGVYSDAHPSVISLRQDIDALSRESPQIGALREEERQLRKEYAARMAQEVRPQAPVAVPSMTVARPPGNVEEDERVREARLQYQQMVERVNSAQLELDAARAAFKYRYNVVWPAQMPKHPVSPNPIKIAALGTIASLVLAILAAAAADLWSGRVVERWQLERVLHLPVLGELRRK